MKLQGAGMECLWSSCSKISEWMPEKLVASFSRLLFVADAIDVIPMQVVVCNCLAKTVAVSDDVLAVGNGGADCLAKTVAVSDDVAVGNADAVVVGNGVVVAVVGSDGAVGNAGAVGEAVGNGVVWGGGAVGSGDAAVAPVLEDDADAVPDDAGVCGTHDVSCARHDATLTSGL